MRIAIDIDDVLAAFQASWVDYYNKMYGSSLTFDDVTDYNFSNLVGHEPDLVIQRFHDFYETEGFMNISPVEGSVEAINLLKKSRFELHLISARKTELLNKTLTWLNLNFGVDTFASVNLTNLFSNDGKPAITKAQVCTDIGAELMIEDAPKYAEDIASRGIEVILLAKPWNKLYMPNNNLIRKVSDWNEATSYIESTLLKNVSSINGNK